MATPKTKVADARHDVGHALLSLVGSIAVAPVSPMDAFAIIGLMLDAWKNDGAYALRTEVESVLRQYSGASNMENVTRHAHELRRAIKDLQRIEAQS